MLKTKIISATEARNKWFEILNHVYFNGESIIIEKNKLPMIKLSRVMKPSLTSAEEVIKKTFGFLKTAKKTAWPVEPKEVRKKNNAYLKKIWTMKNCLTPSKNSNLSLLSLFATVCPFL